VPQAQHPAQFGLPKLPAWALLAFIGFAFLFMGWLDPQHDLDLPAPRKAATMAEAIQMACGSHGARGQVNRYGDIQCLDSAGKPSFYVHVARVQP